MPQMKEERHDPPPPSRGNTQTAQGETLTATMEGSTIVITDAKGGKARVTIGDVYQSNGVIHVIDTVLMPS